MVMSLICLLKMQAAACKIWLSSHIMGYIAQIMNSYRMHVCFDACSSTNSFRSWDDTPKMFNSLLVLSVYIRRSTVPSKNKTTHRTHIRNLKWIGQGVLKLERDMWNGRTDSRTLVYHNTSRLKDGRIKAKNTLSDVSANQS
jgi:hypothetical protein